MTAVSRLMVFALGTDDGGLIAFPSAVEAAMHCEGIDVEDAVWLFFSEDGSPLEARFQRPNRRGSNFAVSGTYVLERAMSGRWLQERLAQVKSVEGCGLLTVAQLEELLRSNRGKRAAAGAKWSCT